MNRKELCDLKGWLLLFKILFCLFDEQGCEIRYSKTNRCCWMHFFHFQVCCLLKWDVQSDIWCQEFYYTAYMRIWNSSLFTFLVYITNILAYFDTDSVNTLPHSRHYHSCLHEIHNYSLSFSTARPCPSWMTAVGDRKMLLFYWSPVDGDIFILLYCYCCWRPITQGLSYTQESERLSSGEKKWWACG